MGHLITHLTAASEVPTEGPAVSIPSGMDDYRGIPAYGPLRHAAKTLPQRSAIRYGSQHWTYEQLNYDALRCAAMWQRLGLRPGDRVGILLPNVPEFIIAANGVWRAGGVAVALSPLMVAEEVQRMMQTTGCRFLVCLDMLAHSAGIEHLLEDDANSAGLSVGALPHAVEMTLLVSIREHLPAIQQLGYLWMRRQKTGRWSLPSGPRVGWFQEELEATRREWTEVKIDPDADPAYILPTGGTTARPKAVTLSHRNLVANAWQQYQWTDRLFGSETMLAVLPFFHSYGLSATVMGGAAMGATLVLHHRFNTPQVIRLIEEHRPTVFHAVPAMLVAMNERLRRRPADLSSLKWVISGGAPLEAEVAEEFARHSGALVVEGYGLSEASPVTHVGPLYDPPRYGTIGLPLPETEVRIVASDDDSDSAGLGREVPPGEIGELVVRGPQVMLGYWNDPEATAEAICDGWLHTGDLATVDTDGFYRIVGRKKDLIITSGFNVFPAEVEEVLCTVPGVSGAAVVGVPDAKVGEIVKAFVEMEPGATWDEAAMRAACEEHLAKHKRPRLYELCSEPLPRNFLGKLIRRRLRGPMRVAEDPDIGTPTDADLSEPGGIAADNGSATEPERNQQ